MTYKGLKIGLKNDSRVFSTRYQVLMKPKQQEIVGYRVFPLLPLVNFKTDFYQNNAFMEIWRNLCNEMFKPIQLRIAELPVQ